MNKIAKSILISATVLVLGGTAVAVVMLTPKKAPDPICWKNLRGTEISDDYKETMVLDEFSRREFVWTKNNVVVNSGGTETFLTGGSPVWAVYFSDLTGDGYREMIAEISTGGSTSNDVVVVYDLKKQTTYTMDEPQRSNFTTYFENGEVHVVKKPYGNPDAAGESGVLKIVDGGLSIT